MRALALQRLIVGAFGLLLLGLYFTRFPPLSPASFELGGIGALRFSKLAGVLQLGCVAILVNAAAWSIGGPICRWLRQDHADSPPLQIGLGLFVLSAEVFLLAALHLLVPIALWLLLIAHVALGVGPLGRGITALAKDRGRAWIPAVSFGLLLIGPVLEAFVPSFGWDALTYHLALPERYLHANAIVVTPFSTYTAFPLTTEMLYALALGIQGTALAKLLHVEFGVLVLWAVWELGVRIASRRAAVVAVAILLADPLFGWELTVAYADLPSCLFALLSAILFLEWIEAPRRRAAVGVGLLAGACVATRLSMFALPVALAVLMLVSWPAQGPSWRKRIEGSTLMIIVAGAALSPYLVRNLIFTGNPFAPALQSFFYPAGQEFFDATSVSQAIALTRAVGMGRGPLELLALPWNLTMNSKPGVYSNSFGFQVGALYLVSCLAAVLVRPVRANRQLRLLLFLGTLLIVAWFFTAQEARYLLPVFPIISVVGGVAFATLAGEGRTARVVLVVPLLGLAVTQWNGLARLGPRWSYALGDSPPPQGELAVEAALVGEELRGILAPTDRLLLLFESRAYYFRGLDYIPFQFNEGAPTLQLVHRASDANALRCRLAELGVTHVLLNRENATRFPPVLLPGYRAEDLVADLDRLSEMLRLFAEPILNRHGIIVGRLRPPPVCTQVTPPERAGSGD